MNKNQFVNMLKVWDEDFLKAREPLEALTSFLKRLKRANERQELKIIKIYDDHKKPERRTSFIDNNTGVEFGIIINYELKEVSLLY